MLLAEHRTKLEKHNQTENYATLRTHTLGLRRKQPEVRAPDCVYAPGLVTNSPSSDKIGSCPDATSVTGSATAEHACLSGGVARAGACVCHKIQHFGT